MRAEYNKCVVILQGEHRREGPTFSIDAKFVGCLLWSRRRGREKYVVLKIRKNVCVVLMAIFLSYIYTRYLDRGEGEVRKIFSSHPREICRGG